MRISSVIGGLVVSACVARADFGGDFQKGMDRYSREQMAQGQQQTQLIIAGMVCATVVVCAVVLRKKKGSRDRGSEGSREATRP